MHRPDPRAERDDVLDVLDRLVGALDRRHVEEQQRQPRQDRAGRRARRRPCRARTSSSTPSTALQIFAGNQCSRKFETTASPASRSDCGRKLQSGSGWTPGARRARLVRTMRGSGASLHPTVRRKSRPTWSRQVHDELAVVGRDRQAEPGERLRRRARRRSCRRPCTASRGTDSRNRCVRRSGCRRRVARLRLATAPRRAPCSPRCVHTAEIAWKVLPSRKTKSRSSGRNLRPSGKSAGSPSFTVVGASYEHVGHERAQRAPRLRADARATPRAGAELAAGSRAGRVGLLLVIIAPSSRGAGESLRDREPLHRHRVGRAADRAQAAADAPLVVLDHRRRAGARRASARGRRARRARRSARSSVVERHEREAVLGADVHAAVAEHALLGVVDRLDVADEAARRLAQRRVGVVAGLDLGDAGAAADVERRRRLAIEDARSPRASGSARSGSSRSRGAPRCAAAGPARYSWIERAARLPLATASIRLRGPNATSPPAKMPGAEVASVAGSTRIVPPA